MEKNLNQTIRELIPFLRKKDIPFAEKFYNQRDFESLFDIVSSCKEIIEKNLHSENPKEEYLNLDMDKITDLFVAVSEYCNILGVNDHTNIFDDCENDEEINVFYEY